MTTLLGHLSQWGGFAFQGEVLCTQGLAYLLREHSAARSNLASKIVRWTTVELPEPLAWRAEARQDGDGLRPDLEGRDQDNTPVVKIEAKLSAPFGPGQLQSYVEALDIGRPTVLLVLVPRPRVEEAKKAVEELPAPSRSGQRSAGDFSVSIQVVSWHDLLLALAERAQGKYRNDLEQFEAMYRTLSGDLVEPLQPIDTLRTWREDEAVFMNVVKIVTRRLTSHHRVYPIGVDPPEQAVHGLEPRGYWRRYVCRPMGESSACFSIGVRDPFASANTPIWLRFHRDTPGYPIILDRLECSDLRERIGRTGGHAWLPLYVKPGDTPEAMIEAAGEQAQKVIRVAYREDEEVPRAGSSRGVTEVKTRMGGRKRLYVDMDGVLVDFESGLDRTPEEDKQQFQGRPDEIPGLFARMDPMPGAIEAYRTLAELFDTYILSTAPWGNPSAWSDKLLWVQRHLGDVAYKRLIITHNKDLNTGDFLIDDRAKWGADRFEGEWIQFGSDEFPDWAMVVGYLKARVWRSRSGRVSDSQSVGQQSDDGTCCISTNSTTLTTVATTISASWLLSPR